MSSRPASLYRRHRPRTFADLVGQETVVRTLRNAVERGRVHHAYLFVGSRGTGKTSTAKILAACLNCEHGPTISPCGECDSCRSIAAATSLDVIEMDAASNNSVDDIRELRESVAFAPVSGRHKVYILDEAHMLSSAAWNAFLKTLEEPPPHTVFVLATTEARKVPATVVDRCQRFDFQRPTVEQIAFVLRRTAEAESLTLPPTAAAAIARAATGSFRDALGTLEQIVSYGGPAIAVEDVLAVLGVADAQLLTETFDAVGAGDARAALLAVASCCEGGRDAAAFAGDLEVRARELLVVQTLDEVPAELSLTAEADAELLAQAGRLPAAAIVRVLELLAIAREAVRAGSDPRTQLELALVKAASPELDGAAQALALRVARLEQALGSGTPTAPAVERATAPLAPSAPTPPSVERATAPLAASAPAPPTAEPPLTPRPKVEAPEVQDAAEPARTPLRVVAAGDLAAVVELWPAVQDSLRAENAMLAAVIEPARPVELEGDELTVAFPPTHGFLKMKAEGTQQRASVTAALEQVSGLRLRVRYELRDELAASAEAAPLDEDELVARFMAEFDAQELPVSQPEGE